MNSISSLVSEIGRTILFFHKLLTTLKYKKISSREVYNQIWKITTQSVLTTGVAGFFVGAIMTVQFALQMKEFGALGFLGGLATSGTIREVGPMLIAFMLSGKVGAYTSAELGTMRVTEQIEAIRCLGADPIQEIILPRFIGIIISSFFLLGLGLLFSIAGGAFLGAVFANVSSEEYFRHIPTIVSMTSIASGLIKCFVFAIIIALICTYRGYTTTGGAKGVGLSVVKTAVGTLVSIVIADWFTSFLGDVMLKLTLGA